MGEATPLLVEPRCAHCDGVASRIELVPPGKLPSQWSRWTATTREAFSRYHDPRSWRFIFEGICAGNGLGDDISADRASQIAIAFTAPLGALRIRGADLYDDAGFCAACAAVYCFDHWGAPATGYGTCPQGHGKSLDPHWSPDF